MADIYLANDKYNATLSSGYTVGDTTLYVTVVPTNVPTIVVVNKGETNETVFTVSGKTSNSLTGVARLKGANVNLDNSSPVTIVNNEDFINQYSTVVASAAALSGLIYGTDGGSTDAYAISLDVAPGSYNAILGVPIGFKANTINTGAATLNVNGLGAKTLKKQGTLDLDDGDIQAGQLMFVSYDGTNFQLIGIGDVTKTGTLTLTNKRITKRISTTASSGTPTPNADTTDMYTVTALAASATFGAPTGTPTDGQTLIIRVKDNGTARSLNFNAIYRFSTDLAAPTTTILSKTLYMGFVYNTANSSWDCLAVLNNFS